MGKITGLFKGDKKSKEMDKLVQVVNSLKKTDETAKTEVKENENTVKVYNKTEDDLLMEYRKTIDRKLVILLVECSQEVYDCKEDINCMIKRIAENNLVCIIRYGYDIEISDVFEGKELKDHMIYGDYENTIYKNLYLSICDLDKEVIRNDGRTMYINRDRFKIRDIDIVGIGTGENTLNENLKDFSQIVLSRLSQKDNIKTKYFCIKDTDIVNTSSIGFHSIGVINTKY